MSSSAIFEEYRSLTEEIKLRDRGMLQIFTISLMVLVPFISGIIIYSMQHWADIKAHPTVFAPYMFLSPLLILIPCTYLLTSLRRNVFRCGTYIQVFLENDAGLRWETALDRFREIHKEESLDPTFVVYWAIFAICSGLFSYALYFLSMSLWHLVAPLLLALLLLKSHLAYRRVPTKTRNEFYEQWLKIKQAMDDACGASNESKC